MATFRENITTKLPKNKEILPVFSTIVFVVFTWTLYRMFWQVPSWLGYMNVWKVIVLTSYVMAFALVESLVFLGFLLILTLIYPARHLKEKFVSQGLMITATLGLGAYLIQRKISTLYKLELWQLIVYPLLILGTLLLFILISSLLFDRSKTLTRLTMNMADRMTVFTYLYVPLSLISLTVVIVRNIL